MSPARKNLVKVREVLPAQPGLPAEAPRMEHEPIHKRLARLVAEQERLTAEIQDHKAKWADRNRVAQDTHQPPSTPEITAFKTYHRELAARLADVNLQIGIANKEVRAHKAERQIHGNGYKPRVDLQKKCPLKAHPSFDSYFRLSAENLLPPGLLKQVESDAKGLLAQALEIGVEE